jgi:alpha-galactosidase/6-phospho-beta-glucosidase family protein
MYTICILGASTKWTPGLVTDLMAVFPEALEIRLIDIDSRNAELCREWVEAAARFHGRKDRCTAFTDRRAALRGADAVLITLSTGGLDAMERDLAIPEKYGIFPTVGDTAGPSGWSRAIRNIPVFMEFARDFQEICPKAFIANYSNPMSALTGTLDALCENPVVGLCHAYFETKDVIQQIFELPDWSPISISIAGMNHFTWVVDFKIGKDDGYALLRQKLGGRSLASVLPVQSMDEGGYYSGHLLCVELYDAFGCLPYPADRHTSEFVSFVLAGHPKLGTVTARDGQPVEATEYCSVKRTPISYRRASLAEREKTVREDIARMRESGHVEPPKRSRETGTDMIAAYLNNKPFSDAVNCINNGQIPGLPLGACVETIGLVDGLGVRPLLVHDIPEHLLEIMRPQAICQKWVVEGVLRKDKARLMQALYRDPLCAQLKPHEVRDMAEELFEANRRVLSL